MFEPSAHERGDRNPSSSIDSPQNTVCGCLFHSTSTLTIRHTDTVVPWPQLNLGCPHWYQQLPNLPITWCVDDVLAMGDCLTKDLGIPRERTQCLLAPSHGNVYTDIGSNPTRANILRLLHSLATNLAIGCGDPIIIYFAGHGTCYLWTEEDADIELEEEHDAECLQNFVEALCPMDRNTFDVSGSLVTDITNRELNATLAQIYSTKDNRIMFIFWTAATPAASCEEWAEKPARFPQ
ncbi:uncharacterized protein ARMOST_07970 [Armillaria ostoyae]|uniref:Peptidase C14 caspase domain-containing protein n=1 Tax=Armillaria ostoyae TaxID=47428 RepID=A0A284R7C0_ARMOS|nr:uncharacterized protein ARMOST_07970 [Armillaria ostoyae]